MNDVSRVPLLGASALLAALALWSGTVHEPRLAALALLGASFGIALHHGRFGFTAAWRRFHLSGDGRGLRAQFLAIGATFFLFAPVIAGVTPEWRAAGAIAPLELSVPIGAFLFGIGMQLGGGCGSGTLFGLGTGSARAAVALAFFVIGALIGAMHLPWWLALPDLGAVGLVRELGLGPALLLQLAALAALAGLSRIVEKRRGFVPSEDEGPFARARRSWSLARGPWPLWASALALALGNLASLYVAGHPWTITFAFWLWGAEAAAAAGIDLSGHAFWSWPFPARALEMGIFANTTSVTNLGLILGAAIAASLAGRFGGSWRVSPKPLAAAILGGLSMGYGARLAFGCNIGAYVSGVASGSLHGWVWFACAFLGSMLGTRLRPAFDLR